MDNYILLFDREIDKLFLMVVENVVLIIGWGIVVMGWVERGFLVVGEIIEIVGL